MKKNNRKHFCLILLIASFFVLSSCTNLFNSSAKDKKDSKKTYLSVNVGKIKQARTVNPANMPIEEVLPLFSDFNLSGVFEATGEVFNFLDDVPSVDALAESKIELSAGMWEFTLSGKFNGIIFKGSEVVEIKEGEENIISFALKASENYGGYAITFDVSASITEAEILLQTKDGTLIEKNTVEAVGSKIIASRNITKETTRLESGTYLLSVKFYAGESVLINTWENYVAIQPGVMTTAEIALDFNSLYTITYDFDGGELSGGLKVENYSVRSSFELPEASKANAIFLGWFESDGGNIATSPTTEISLGSRGDKTFVAKYQSTDIYVASSGDDDTGDGSETTPLKTINKACEVIEAYGVADTEWTIYVNGTLTTSESQIIPETLTEDVAASILITGATGLDSDGEPQDVIDRNIAASTGGSTSGNILIVSSSVPVTITNLKLMRGAAADGSALKVNQGATVKLGDGVLITKNYYQSGYGTVRNEGTLFMYGSAVIGDKNATTYAFDSSSPSYVTNGDNANYSGSGGGIYNGSNSPTSTIVAKLYLGYSGYDSDGVTPVKEALTGGIYKNGGGGIYNSYNSFVYFDSGTIAWNAKDNGAGIYNQNSGTVEMSGGSIINNKCESSSDVAGGGLYNAMSSSKFIMSGGTINQNIVKCTNTASSSSHGYGGGVYNAGYMFMYGSAVIGNKAASSLATSSDYGNYAREGGGIYNDNNSASSKVGKLYIGYEPSSYGTSPVKAEFTGGIYQNYADTLTSQTNGGGAISSDNTVQIASGTIAYNATSRFGGAIYSSNSFEITGGTIRDNDASVSGGAIYMAANSSYILTLGGSFEIPYISGGNDIFLAGSSATYHASIQISDSLDGSFEAMLTPGFYAEGVQYISLATGSTANLAAEVQCFEVTPQVSGTVTTEWAFDSNGKLQYTSGSAEVTFSFTEISSSGDVSVTEKTTGTTATFSEATGTYSTYSWYLDDTAVTEATSNNYVLDLTTISNGIHDIYLEVTDSEGNYYSWSGQYSKS